MASLRTILACAVPAVTALFGIIWLFNRKKKPPSLRITEPPDKQTQLTEGTAEDQQKDHIKSDKETITGSETVKFPRPTALDNVGCGDTVENLDQKQNEKDEMINEIENAFKDILKDSEQSECQISESSERVLFSVQEGICGDEMKKENAAKLSDIHNIVQEDAVTRQNASDLNQNAVVDYNVTVCNTELIEEKESISQEEAIIASTTNFASLESDAISLSCQSQDVTNESDRVLAIESLVIPSDEMPLKSESNNVQDWSRNAEDSLTLQQKESVIESQLISEPVELEASLSSKVQSSTSQNSQGYEICQKTNSEQLQNEMSNSVGKSQCDSKSTEQNSDQTFEASAIAEPIKVGDDLDNTGTDWVSDKTERKSWVEESIAVENMPKTTVSNSWAVNGDQVDSVQPIVKENVISNKSTNTFTYSNHETLNKEGGVERRNRHGGSVNSSESSSNCDSSSVTSSGSSRGGSTPEIQNHRQDDQEHIYEFNMPSDLCGLFIGSRGKTIKGIRDQSGARIKLRNNPYTPEFQICVIEGPQSAIDKACSIIKRKFPAVKYPGIDLTPINNSPVLMPEIMQLSLPEGVSVDVVVSSIVDAGRVFIQQPTHPSFPSLERLNTYMLSCYMQEGAVPDIPRPIENGVICAAPMLNGWYRAQIMAVHEASDECDIKYVDYGGYSRISSMCLKQIRSDFMTLPFEAVECYMANVTPLQGETYFSPEAAAVLEELTQGKLLQAQVVGKAEDGIPYVHIYQISGNTSALMVNREMVNRGVARWIEILS